MKLLLTLLVITFVISIGKTQPTLKPSIGISSLPNDSDTICNTIVYNGNFDTSGYAIGDTIPDFTLYTSTGTPVNIQSVLGQGKPVLLISGSLTCPVFRNKLAEIDNIANIYAGLLDVFIIYGQEAHPTTPSPYSGNVWITNANQQAGILFPQPITYGERKALLDTLLSYYNVNVPILLDGTCNEWIRNFGPAPNNAYLIDTTGVIYEKQGWFNKIPDNIYCEIDSLLGTNSGGACSIYGNNGIFGFNYQLDTIDSGVPGNILAVHGTFTNLSSNNNVVIDIIRWSVSTPANWQTAMCTDICLPSSVDTTQITIPPSDTQDFTFYFYTDPAIPGVGSATLGFKNANINQNKFFRDFWGSTSKGTNINNLEPEISFSLSPNPSSQLICVESSLGFDSSIEIIDLSGKKIKSIAIKSWESKIYIDISNLNNGLYILKTQIKEKQLCKKFVVTK